MYLRAHISALSFQLARLLRSSPSAEVNRSPLPDLMTAILYFLPLHSVQMRSTSDSISLFCWSSFVSHTSTIFDFSNMFTSMVHHSFTLSFGIIYLHYSFSHLPVFASMYSYFSLRRQPYFAKYSQYHELFHILTPRFFPISDFDPNFQILHSPIFRSALPIRGELAGGLTPAFFLQTVNRLEKGYGFSRFSGRRNAVCYACRSRRPTSVLPLCPFFHPLIYRPTRSTLRDNRFQQER